MDNENTLPEVSPETINFEDTVSIPDTEGNAKFDSSDHPDVGCHFSSSQVSRPPRPSRNKAGSSKENLKSISKSPSASINHKSPRPHSGVVSLPSLDFQELAQKYSELIGSIKSLTKERDTLKNDLWGSELNLKKRETELTDAKIASSAIDSARGRAEKDFDELQSNYNHVSTRNRELEEMNKILRRDCVREKKQSENLKLLNLSLVSQVAEQKEVVTIRERKIQVLLEEMAPMRRDLEIARREILRFEEMQMQLEEELWLADEGQEKWESKSGNDPPGSQSILNRNSFDKKRLSGLFDKLDRETGNWARSSNESDSRPQSSGQITRENLRGPYVKEIEATLAEELGGKYEDGEVELTESPISYADAKAHTGEQRYTFTETLPAIAYVNTELQTKSGPRETEREKQPAIRYVDSGVQISPRNYFDSDSQVAMNDSFSYSTDEEKPQSSNTNARALKFAANAGLSEEVDRSSPKIRRGSVSSTTNKGYLPGLAPEVTPTELFYRDNAIPTISVTPEERYQSFMSGGSKAEGDVQDALRMLSEFPKRAMSSSDEPSLADWARAISSKSQNYTSNQKRNAIAALSDASALALESKVQRASGPIHQLPRNRHRRAVEGGWRNWFPSIRKGPANQTREQSGPSPDQDRRSSDASDSSGTSSKLSITSFLDSRQVPEPGLHHGKPEVTVRDYAFERQGLSERGHGSVLSLELRRLPNDQSLQEKEASSIGISPISAEVGTAQDAYPQAETQSITLEKRLANISTAPTFAKALNTRGSPAEPISNTGDGKQEASNAVWQLLEHGRPETNAFSSLSPIVQGFGITPFSKSPRRETDHGIYLPALRGFFQAFFSLWAPTAVSDASFPCTSNWRLYLLVLIALTILSRSFFAEKRLWRDANELTRRAVVAMRDEKWGGPVWADKVGYTVDGIFGLRSDREGWVFC